MLLMVSFGSEHLQSIVNGFAQLVERPAECFGTSKTPYAILNEADLTPVQRNEEFYFGRLCRLMLIEQDIDRRPDTYNYVRSTIRMYYKYLRNLAEISHIAKLGPSVERK